MANETAEATSTTSEMTGLFDQAFRALGDSFKVAMRAQEDALRFWSEAVGKVNPVQPVPGDLIPMAQKNAEEYLRLLETSYRRNAELVKKAIHSQAGGDGSAIEKQTRQWLEASIAAARENAQDLASTNLRVAQAWTEAFKKGTQHAQAVQEKVAAAVK